MTILEFLDARISEDEARAEYVLKYGDWGGLFKPPRILAECAAKRAIMQHAIVASEDRAAITEEYCMGQAGRGEAYASDPGLLIIRALASIYANHPDYQQEWE